MRQWMSAGLAALAAVEAALMSGVAYGQSAVINDYPTATRADYVFGCMQANGGSRLFLESCACSIDVIASILPHDAYTEAETVMSLRLRGGESVAQMQHPIMQAKVHALKLAQIEGELRCF